MKTSKQSQKNIMNITQLLLEFKGQNKEISLCSIKKDRIREIRHPQQLEYIYSIIKMIRQSKKTRKKKYKYYKKIEYIFGSKSLSCAT